MGGIRKEDQLNDFEQYMGHKPWDDIRIKLENPTYFGKRCQIHKFKAARNILTKENSRFLIDPL